MREFTKIGFALLSALVGLSTGCGTGDDQAIALIEAGHEGSAGDGAAKSEGGGGGSEGGADATTTTDAGSTALKHVFYIMMENHSYAEILGPDAGANAPYLNMLASKYGVATKYYGVTHPSLPNYLAAISGDFQGIFDDCAAGPSVTCAPEEFIPTSGDNTDTTLMTASQAVNAAMIPHWFSGKNIVDQLEDKGLTWKAYMESIAAVGDPSEYWPYIDAGVPAKLYAQKHDPFMYFEDIRTNTARMQKIVPFTQLATDIAADNVPNFVWISPNQCSDMHSLSTTNAAFVGVPSCAPVPVGDAGATDDSAVIKLGDTFIQNTVTAIMSSSAFKNEPSVIVIAWDEDDYAGTAGCCNSPTGVDGGVLGGANAPAIVIPSVGAKPVTSATPYNHYSLLGTIQKAMGLPCLANTCSMKPSDLMTSLFAP
jgi:hypothetical protein